MFVIVIICQLPPVLRLRPAHAGRPPVLELAVAKCHDNTTTFLRMEEGRTERQARDELALPVGPDWSVPEVDQPERSASRGDASGKPPRANRLEATRVNIAVPRARRRTSRRPAPRPRTVDLPLARSSRRLHSRLLLEGGPVRSGQGWCYMAAAANLARAQHPVAQH